MVTRRVYQARKGQVAYGYSVGIVCLEYFLPFIPGDVGNASTYDFPVLYHEVKGATFDAIILRQDPAMLPVIVEAAEELVRQGCKAVTSDCGYFGAYQREVASAVAVPVFMSSLMQVPFILSMLAPEQKVAALVANGASLSDRFLDQLSIRRDADRIVFRGLEDKPEFRATVLDECGTLDVEAVEQEVVDAALEVREEHPEVGAILLECSDLPPYSAAVQAATGLPVFDWIGFINYVHQAVDAKPYSGSF
ncbi:MAG TPA: aspartate/glutamate racemase family protein [Gaiellaceae bacterium]